MQKTDTSTEHISMNSNESASISHLRDTFQEIKTHCEITSYELYPSTGYLKGNFLKKIVMKVVTIIRLPKTKSELNHYDILDEVADVLR